MLEKAGYRLPEEHQLQWDNIHKESVKRKAAMQARRAVMRKPPTSVSEGGPSDSPPAAAPSTRAPGQTPRIKAEEVVDLSADSTKASSCTQLLDCLEVSHASPDKTTPGHFASDGDANSLVLKQEQRVPATGASVPLASPHAGPDAPSVQRVELCTLNDVIADLTRLKALEAQIAAAGLHINLDRDLQCLQLVCDREGAHVAKERCAERRERLLLLKDTEIKSLRSQLDILRA
ncbi:hypothetical protein WJX75_008752 [Coccomyxa subellipsoidea]|uniref:Enkurin domain-containing protein n=1 Tax=Coccomyxa subellipsoidea TaxID=248742 RepID=A0ABR2YDD3_9CHLO